MAIDTIHQFSKHPLLQPSVKEKNIARVMGSERGVLSPLWKKHGSKGAAAVSKSDIAIMPKHKNGKGIALSLKKGDAQLMSAGPEENAATHEYATLKMVHEHPQYALKSHKEKKDIHKSIMDQISKLSTISNAARGITDKDKIRNLILQGQKHLNNIHNEHPALNNYLRREATTGEGKFSHTDDNIDNMDSNSLNDKPKDLAPEVAQFLVTSGTGGNTKVAVKHATEANYDGPRPFLTAAKNPRGPLAGRLIHKAERVEKPPRIKKEPTPRKSRAKIKVT